MAQSFTESGKLILVVDDEPSVIDTVTRMLARSGYETLSARSGEEAIEIAQEHVPNLILLDVRMPIMDGISTLKNLKQIEKLRHVPVIIMTGYASLETAIRSLRLGAVDYLQKPIQIHSLRLAVSDALSRDRLSEEALADQVRKLRQERDDLLRRLENLDGSPPQKPER